MHSPYTRHLAGTGVIGACSHAGPGSHALLRLPLRCAVPAVNGARILDLTRIS
jgi:hypothetical protein